MATFKFNGDFDKVSAELKKTFEAQDARFNASLQALFKPSPAEPAAKSHASSGWTSNDVRNHGSNGQSTDGARDRLRNSVRPR